MNKLFVISLLVLFSFRLDGQVNLMLNGDFEDTISCPITMLGEIEKARHWTSPCTGLHTTDYFSLCSYKYIYFFQGNSIMPKSGSGFAGIALFPQQNSVINYREYLEGQLSQQLKEGKEYCIQFYMRPNKNNELLTNEIQFYFSDNIVRSDSCGMLLWNINPQININISHVNDTSNWSLVTANFVATGNEKYVTIGNFKTNNQTDTVWVGWWVTRSYYYLDDIRIYYCGPDTTQSPVIDSLIIPNIFTPNGDGYNDKFEYKNQEQWEFETQVFNRWGDLVFDNKSSENWDGFYKGNKVSAGVYFYIIKAQAIRTGEMTIQKGHVTVMY